MYNFYTSKILFVFNLLEKYGKEARLVGGCVRDHILGRTINDYDFSITATPQEMIEICIKENISFFDSGISHGTITVMIDGEGFELTTLRSDVETDGRHATVEFVSDWRTDSERRDFSFNAMYLDKDGVLYDYHNGLNDLTNKVVRFVGDADKRVKEDALRILRFFRFATRFKAFNLDQDAINAITNNLDMLDKLSVERVHSEFTKIFSTEDNLWAFNTMRNMGVFDKFFDTTNLKTPKMDFPNSLYFYSFVSDEYDFMRKFKATNFEINQVNKVFSLPPVKEGDMDFDNMVFLFSYENVSKETFLMKVFNSQFLNEDQFNQFKNTVEQVEVKTFPLAGKNLIDAGYKSGPQFADMLKFAKTKWLFSNYTADSDALVEFVKQKFNFN